MNSASLSTNESLRPYIMLTRFKISFNSKILMTYFIVSALVFSVMLIVIWKVSINAKQIKNRQYEVTTIINGITGSILGSAELDSQGFPNQSQSLMQDYLNYVLNGNGLKQRPVNIVRVRIFLLDHSRQLIGEWLSSNSSFSKCTEHRSEYFQPTKSKFPYLIDLDVDTCAPITEGFFDDQSLAAPITVSFALMLLWGLCIFVMLSSVSIADKLLTRTKNIADLIEKTATIRWKNVRNLTERALQVKGQNLQYYQTLVLDAQHDISKSLDLINKKYSETGIEHDVAAIRGIIQKMATELRSSDLPSNDVTSNREVNIHEIVSLAKTYFGLASIECKFPEHCYIFVSDISLFERIIINLASNSIKHSISTSKLFIYYKDEKLYFVVTSSIGYYQFFLIKMAQYMNRIDLSNPELPVYQKLIGSSGRGLSIIKKACIKLGGSMIFSIKGRSLETGFILFAYEAKLPKNISDIKIIRKKVIFMSREDLKEIVIKCGLSDFLVTEDELKNLITNTDKLEIVTDTEINVSKNVTLRVISKKERIEGIALNWLGDQKT